MTLLPAGLRPHSAQHQFAAVRPERHRQFAADLAQGRGRHHRAIAGTRYDDGERAAGDFGVADKAGNIVATCPQAGADFGGIFARPLPADRGRDVLFAQLDQD
jgi:hypothetical protein